MFLMYLFFSIGSRSSSSVGSNNSIQKVPWKCAYCEHTFSRFENKSKHIADCRHANEHDAKTVKRWVDLISQTNNEVMSEAITEAIRHYEEKVYHRKTALLLLKQIQTYCRKGTVDQMLSLCEDISAEKEELNLLILPIKIPKFNANANRRDYTSRRNKELVRMSEYLTKGIAILKRNIARQNSFHIEDFTVGNILNTGSFSTVHLAKCKATEQLYALKVMKREFLREQKMVSDNA
jgi:hypothetical protein